MVRSVATVVQNTISHDGIDFGKRPVSEASDKVSMAEGGTCYYLQAPRKKLD